MNKVILLLLLIPVTVSAQFKGPYAPPAGQQGSTAIHKDSSAFKAWAASCIIDRGPMNITQADSGDASHGTPSACEGKTDGSVISLGDGGIAYITFGNAIFDGPGPDFAVFENSFADDFLELAFVEVSSDGQNFYRFPSVSLTQDTQQVESFSSTDATNIYNLAGKYRADYGVPFDLAELDTITGLNIDSVTHVRVIDVVGNIDTSYATYDSEGNMVNDPWPTDFESGGFDLDAVGVIHFTGKPQKISKKNDPILTIYPNPASDFLAIRGLNREFSYEIYDINGRIIKNGFILKDKYQIDIRQLPEGAYQVQLKNNDDHFSRHFIIAR